MPKIWSSRAAGSGETRGIRIDAVRITWGNRAGNHIAAARAWKVSDEYDENSRSAVASHQPQPVVKVALNISANKLVKAILRDFPCLEINRIFISIIENWTENIKYHLQCNTDIWSGCYIISFMPHPEASNLHIGHLKLINRSLKFNFKMKTASILSLVSAFIAVTAALPVATESVCNFHYEWWLLPAH